MHPNFSEIRKNQFSPGNSSKLLSPSPSLRPFPVVNNEFYNEAKNNVLWQSEAKKLKAERSLSRNNTERKYLRNNLFIFNKVNHLIIFNIWEFSKINLQSEIFKNEKSEKNDISLDSEINDSRVSNNRDKFTINPINK